MNDKDEMDFIKTVTEAGLEPPNKILVDGRFHRFFPKEDRVTSRVGISCMICPTALSQVHSAAGERVSSSHGLPSKCQH